MLLSNRYSFFVFLGKLAGTALNPWLLHHTCRCEQEQCLGHDSPLDVAPAENISMSRASSASTGTRVFRQLVRAHSDATRRDPFNSILFVFSVFLIRDGCSLSYSGFALGRS